MPPLQTPNLLGNESSIAGHGKLRNWTWNEIYVYDEEFKTIGM